MNFALLVGNVGLDPELRFSPTGKPCLIFDLATHTTFVNNEGVKSQRTNWHRCKWWGDGAKNTAQYIYKGRHIGVVSRSETRTYKKGGETRYITEQIVREVELYGGQSNNGVLSIDGFEAERTQLEDGTEFIRIYELKDGKRAKNRYTVFGNSSKRPAGGTEQK